MSGTPWTPDPNWEIETNNDTDPNDEGFWEWLTVGPAKFDLSRFGDNSDVHAYARLFQTAPAMAEALEKWSYHTALGRSEEAELRKETDAILSRLKGA